MTNMGCHWDNNLKVYIYRMKRSSKVIYNYDDPTEFGHVNVEEKPVEDQDRHVDTKIDDTHHANDYTWLCYEEQHEDLQGWGQWQQNSCTQHDTTYGNNSRVDSSGEESSIIPLMESRCVEKQERHQEESHRRDTFEVTQEERFKLVHEHLNSQDTKFNNFATYITKQLNQTRQDMAFNLGATQTGINNIVGFQNDNHHHYHQFYSEMCDFLDAVYGNEGVAWYRGERPETRSNIGYRN